VDHEETRDILSERKSQTRNDTDIDNFLIWSQQKQYLNSTYRYRMASEWRHGSSAVHRNAVLLAEVPRNNMVTPPSQIYWQQNTWLDQNGKTWLASCSMVRQCIYRQAKLVETIINISHRQSCIVVFLYKQDVFERAFTTSRRSNRRTTSCGKLFSS
jgi:hypothetical protein